MMFRDPMFEATDCACSALICNCCQTSCCLPTTATTRVRANGPRQQPFRHHHGNVVNYSTWMEQVGNIDLDIKFRDLILIGSHDAASFSVSPWRPYSALTQRQNYNVTQQLQAGVRLLDVRLAGTTKAGATSNRTTTTTWHGHLQGGNVVETVLQPVKDFVQANPYEMVVLQLVPAFGRDFDLEQKQHALQLFKETLGDKIILHGTHMADLLQSWTLRDLRNQQGRVMVLVHQQFFSKPNSHRFNEQSVLEQYGFASMDKWLHSLWFNTRQADTLLDYALQDVVGHGRQRRHFHSSQLVLTPGVTSFVDIIAALVGINKLRPASLAYHLYTNTDLGSYLRQHAQHGWNWVWLDFVDLAPWIVHFLMALNIPVGFELHVAIYQEKSSKRSIHKTATRSSVNVTAKIQTCVCRGRVLFIDSIRQVLDLSPQSTGTLTLLYTIGGKAQIFFGAVEESIDSVLLSSLGNSCDNDCITTIPSGLSHGCIHNGSVLSEVSDLVSLQDTIISFTNINSTFSYQVHTPGESRDRNLDDIQAFLSDVEPTESSLDVEIKEAIDSQSIMPFAAKQDESERSEGLDASVIDSAVVVEIDTHCPRPEKNSQQKLAVVETVHEVQALVGETLFPFKTTELEIVTHEELDGESCAEDEPANVLKEEAWIANPVQVEPLAEDSISSDRLTETLPIDTFEPEELNTVAEESTRGTRFADRTEPTNVTKEEPSVAASLEVNPPLEPLPQQAVSIDKAVQCLSNVIETTTISDEVTEKEVSDIRFEGLVESDSIETTNAARGTPSAMAHPTQQPNASKQTEQDLPDQTAAATTPSDTIADEKQMDTESDESTESAAVAPVATDSVESELDRPEETVALPLSLHSKIGDKEAKLDDLDEGPLVVEVYDKTMPLEVESYDPVEQIAPESSEREDLDQSETSETTEYSIVDGNEKDEQEDSVSGTEKASEDRTLVAEMHGALGAVYESYASNDLEDFTEPGEDFTYRSTSECPNFLVLLSTRPSNRKVLEDQKMALYTLKAIDIAFATIDGAESQNQHACEKLFDISGVRGEYPQFFVLHVNGTKSFWGGMDVFVAAKQKGTLEDDLFVLSM